MPTAFPRLAAALALAGACAAPALALEIDLPKETATLHAASGAQNAAQCYMCHSVDYISSQPPMPAGFWEAEVKKMVQTYGAPITAEQIPLIVRYLDEAYPPQKK
ncbi:MULTISPECIES: hypothetical protein [unclassified Achromobacter]|uniref:SorB family sulfite dehydrogenase c-type cytochrome subunit n=1 Tax=unclassified Achromobacter TaxID=2626865 RepID=UPI00069FE489|nr:MULTISPECIES: hypothetical protein [unclassified Achromobacter]KOF52246.1 sulfite:cytochrome C oxidoreductase subunit B [Achromobacter sp. DMS1]